MSDTKLRPPVKDPKNEKGEPVKAPRWRNMYFRKDGSYGFGMTISDTEEKAKSFAEAVVELLHKPVRIGHISINQVLELESHFVITPSTFSHHMQIPWCKQ